MIEKLGRYTLSIILSYLEERDGISFLLTNTRYTYQLLPLFRIITARTNDDDSLVTVLHGNSEEEEEEASLSSSSSSTKQQQQQQSNSNNKYYIYKFVVSPIQDTVVLLQRLNTRKLYQQLRYKYIEVSSIKNNTIHQISVRQWHTYIQNYETDEKQQLQQQQQQQSVHNNNNNYPPAYLQLVRLPSSIQQIDTNFWYTIPTNIRTVIASYPRCGNTLVRTLLEQVTGYVTGSDTRPDRILSRQLSEQYNLIGEGIVTLPIVKTHWPERTGCLDYNCQQAIVVVRNPYDAMDSYFNFNATCSHTKTVDNTVYDEYATVFTNLVRNEIHVWIAFYNYWCNIVQIPILIVRYEDIISRPQYELHRMIQFVLGKAPSEPLPPFWIHRINLVTSNTTTTTKRQRHNKLQSYQPRSSSSSSSSTSSSSSSATKSNTTGGRSLHRYSKELLEYIQTTTAYDTKTNRPRTRNYLQYFGYDSIITKNDDPENPVLSPRNDMDDTFTTNDTTNNNNNNDNNTCDPIGNGATTTGSTNAIEGIQESWRNCGNDNHQHQSLSSSIALRINNGDPYARPNDCPYGRLFYKWRHSVTNNDTNPLPTISK